MEAIKVSVDINIDLSESTKQFLTTLFSNAQPAATAKPAQPAAPTKPAEPTKPAAQATKPAEPTKPAAQATKPAAPAKPAEPATKPAEPTKPAATEPTKPVKIDLEAIRVAAAPRINIHREKIKEELTKLGTDSITRLDASHYEEMYDFLLTLPIPTKDGNN